MGLGENIIGFSVRVAEQSLSNVRNASRCLKMGQFFICNGTD